MKPVLSLPKGPAAGLVKSGKLKTEDTELKT